MNELELINNIKDLLVRTQGTMNVLAKPDIILASRKMQGIKDKLQHILNDLCKKDNTNNLVNKLRDLNENR